MTKSGDRIHADGSGIAPVKTLSGFLAASLELEEQIANGVYSDYTDPQIWPPELDPQTFEKIKNYLNLLIDDTKRHKKIIRKIQKSL